MNTPTKSSGEGAGRAADLQYWEKTARQILSTHQGDTKIVVEKSTVPVRTAEAMERILNRTHPAATVRGRLQPRVPGGGDGISRSGDARTGS